MNQPKSFHDDQYMGAHEEYRIDAETLASEGRFTIARPRLPMERPKIDVLEPYEAMQYSLDHGPHPTRVTRWRLLRQFDSVKEAVTFARAEETQRAKEEAERRAKNEADEAERRQKAKAKREADEKRAQLTRHLDWAKRMLADEEKRVRAEKEHAANLEKARRIVAEAEAAGVK